MKQEIDRKKGKKTDYVGRQYLGSIGKIDNGIVSVNAYGVAQNLTFPLICKVFKPQKSFKPEDGYKTKIELESFSRHQQWDSQGGWKSTLNNLRLIIQPTILLGLIFPGLDIFPNQYLLLGFHKLILVMNQFPFYFSRD